jgi:two-component system NtrC family sensor kinase
MASNEQQITLLKRQLAREKGGRARAEELLENKARELYTLNSQLSEALESLKQQELKLVQQEKLASIGLLAAGVAHEINTPAGYVISNLETVHEYLSDLHCFYRDVQTLTEPCANTISQLATSHQVDYVFDDLPGLLNDTLKGMQRIASIVRDLRSFSRRDRSEHEFVLLDNVIKEALNLTSNELKYHVDVQTNLNCKTPFYCSPTKLSQLFLNLIINAGQAINEQGTLLITTSETNEGVELCFSDNGKGIAKEQLATIFDPFFTTKPIGVGTGLGLSISQDIVHQHQGDIQVNSELGKGTTFIITLPLIKRWSE